MKAALTSAAWIGLAVTTGCVPSLAQLRDNTEKQMTCEDHGGGGGQARHCDIREQTVASVGRLNVDAGTNGGATVKGWLRSDVLVRARVDAAGDTEAAAAQMASQVKVDSSGGQVRATGPDPGHNSWWSVSYEIFVPQNSDLEVKTHNGGVMISDVRGAIHFDVTNGGVHLKRVAGDVTGATVNGGLHVELGGAVWDGRQLDVSTLNGGVKLEVPSTYSAHIQAETQNGGLHSDFAAPVDTNEKPRRLDFTVGSGGAPIHVATTNGGVSVTRIESQ